MSLICPGGKKQAWLKDGIQKIHTVFENNDECIEEFNPQDGTCILRKWRRIDKLGRLSDWDIEIGEPVQKQEIVTGLFTSASEPVVSRHDTQGYYVFRITNMPWPLNNYQVTVDGNDLVLRTENKKYFKRLQITDLIWQKMPLVQQFVNVQHVQQTLVVMYRKPPAVVEFEKAARQARNQNIQEKGCQAQ